MLAWLQPLTMLSDRARTALSTVWNSLTQERQDALAQEIITGAEAVEAMEEQVMAELARQEQMIADLTELVTRTEQKVDALEARYRSEDEDAATLNATEATLDSFSENQQ